MKESYKKITSHVTVVCNAIGFADGRSFAHFPPPRLVAAELCGSSVCVESEGTDIIKT